MQHEASSLMSAGTPTLAHCFHASVALPLEAAPIVFAIVACKSPRIVLSPTKYARPLRCARA
eukprot:2567732-Amphidinium_carterae.1